MTHVMRLDREPFFMIKSGIKTVEMRLNDEKRRLIGVGDEVVFVRRDRESETLSCKVVRLHVFASFEELYSAIPVTRLGYTEQTASEASFRDMEKYYSPEEQKKYGVLGIEIEAEE